MRKLIPLTLAAALLAPVVSLATGATVADATGCPSTITVPWYSKVNGRWVRDSAGTKTYNLFNYTPGGTTTPEVLYYGTGRDSTSAVPGGAGNVLIGGHNSTRPYWTRSRYDYYEKFLKRYPKPAEPTSRSSAAVRNRWNTWKAHEATWLRANRLSVAPAANKNPAPFQGIEGMRAGDVIVVSSGCRKHMYKVLNGSHEIIRPTQSSYALRNPQGAKATAIKAANTWLPAATNISTAKLLTLYGCVPYGGNDSALRKIVRAIYAGSTAL